MHNRLFYFPRGGKAIYATPKNTRSINFGPDKTTRNKMKRKTAKEMLARDDMEFLVNGKHLFNEGQRQSLKNVLKITPPKKFPKPSYFQQPGEDLDEYLDRIHRTYVLKK